MWPTSRTAAVSLSYDDALSEHPTLVGPLLRRHGLCGTFYAPTGGDSHVTRLPQAWRDLAAAGHELGNHSLFHPCRQSPQMSWVRDEYDLRRYNAARLEDELRTASRILGLIDGRSERSYGNTCCHTTIGGDDQPQSMTPVLQALFPAARGSRTDRIIDPATCDPYDLGCHQADWLTLDQLQAIVLDAERQGGWAILMFHGVGPANHPMFIDADVHARFVAWLADRPRTWTAPVIEIAQHVLHQRRSGPCA
jgi:peptidoglycan/xylan/chitin deacetylase (PgdA/CDA1 family)